MYCVNLKNFGENDNEKTGTDFIGLDVRTTHLAKHAVGGRARYFYLVRYGEFIDAAAPAPERLFVETRPKYDRWL